MRDKPSFGLANPLLVLESALGRQESLEVHSRQSVSAKSLLFFGGLTGGGGLSEYCAKVEENTDAQISFVCPCLQLPNPALLFAANFRLNVPTLLSSDRGRTV